MKKDILCAIIITFILVTITDTGLYFLLKESSLIERDSLSFIIAASSFAVGFFVYNITRTIQKDNREEKEFFKDRSLK